jgi:hypothetical protein
VASNVFPELSYDVLESKDDIQSLAQYAKLSHLASTHFVQLVGVLLPDTPVLTNMVATHQLHGIIIFKFKFVKISVSDPQL